MPADAANSVGLFGISMATCSHMANLSAMGKFVQMRIDDVRHINLHRAMTRRGDARGRSDWYLREWMDALKVRQTDIMQQTGWSKATASQLYTGAQNYSPKVVIEAAAALNVRPFELLMPVEEAMMLRRLRAVALSLAHTTEQPQPMPEIIDDLPLQKSSHKAK